MYKDRTVERPYRFHVLGFAHLPVNDIYNSCAYTQKIIKFCKMMLSLGHEVYVYGAEGSNVPCTEFIETHKLSDIRWAWGDYGNDKEIGYDWRNSAGFRVERNDEKTIRVFGRMAETMKIEIKKRARPDDFLCLTQGEYHKQVADYVKLFLTVETGIGYMSSYANFRAFESAMLQNYTYGVEDLKNKDSKGASSGKTGLGKFYDRVIPNFFDPTQFDATQPKKDYLLFCGRIIAGKGVHIAIELAKKLKYKLIIAGQGSNEITIAPEDRKYVKVVGYANIKKRKKLMAEARGFIYPTIYREPFGGSIVEAMLSGCPVLTTNFGAFPEIVQNGINGFRCDTFQDFVDGAKRIIAKEFEEPVKKYLVLHLADKYLMDSVKWEYQKWFDELYDLYTGTRSVAKALKAKGIDITTATKEQILEVGKDMQDKVWYRLHE